MITSLWPWTRAKSPARPAGSGDPSRWRWLGFGGPQTAVKYQQSLNALQAVTHPTVSRCIAKIAQSVQTADWVVTQPKRAKRFKGRDNRATKDELQALIEEPNPAQSGAQFRHMAAQYWAATGCLYVLVLRNMRGIPAEMWLLSPTRVNDVYDDRGGLRGHEYRIGTRTTLYPTRSIVEADDAKADAEQRSPDYKPYVHKIESETLDLATSCDGRPRPYTPLNALALPVQIVELLMQRAVDTASGHPNSRYILTVDSLITRQQEQSATQQLEDRKVGGESSGNVLVAYGTNAKVTKLDNDLSDIHSKMPLDDMERRIAGAFGIPAAILGLTSADGSKFAQNYAESRAAFWEDTVEAGYLAPIEEGLTRAICPAGFEVAFDRGSIPALQDAIAVRAERLEKNTIMSIGEKRRIAGLPATLPQGEIPHSPKPAEAPAMAPDAGAKAAPGTERPAIN